MEKYRIRERAESTALDIVWRYCAVQCIRRLRESSMLVCVMTVSIGNTE